MSNQLYPERRRLFYADTSRFRDDQNEFYLYVKGFIYQILLNANNNHYDLRDVASLMHMLTEAGVNEVILLNMFPVDEENNG